MKNAAIRGAAWLASWGASLWAAYHEGIIVRQGRPLSAEELEWCTQLGIRTASDVHIMTVDEVPNPLRNLWLAVEKCFAVRLMEPAGITLGHGIYVVHGQDTPELIAHELVHISQYERAGSIRRFMQEYLSQCMTAGYHDAPWEREARQKSSLATSEGLV